MRRFNRRRHRGAAERIEASINVAGGLIAVVHGISAEQGRRAFRAFWETFGQSVNMMVSGEVVIESIWSPAVTAIKVEGVPCVYAFSKEGMRGWHGGCAISSKVTGKALDRAYEYINWWLDGWGGAFVARQGYYMSVPENVKKHLEPEEWDFWYETKPAAKELPDPFGTIIVEKGKARDGGSYWNRFSN